VRVKGPKSKLSWRMGAVTGPDVLQQAPALEPSHAGLVNEVGRHDVTGEGGLVDQQHPVALAGK
jgi:hypothetical protein